MRRILASVVSLGLIAGPMAAARADQCTRPLEKTAFNVAGLKSQLMVTAISCQAEEKYNSFVTRFRTDLVAHEATLNKYFQRSFGRRAQKEHDDYITSLANSQSQEGIKSGTLFCQKMVGMFDEVLALKDGKALPDFAATKTLVQPVVLLDCPAPASSPAKVIRTASIGKPTIKK